MKLSLFATVLCLICARASAETFVTAEEAGQLSRFLPSMQRVATAPKPAAPKTLQQLYAEAQPLASTDSIKAGGWLRADPSYNQGFTIKDGSVIPTLDYRTGLNGIDTSLKAALKAAGGAAVFLFEPVKSAIEENDMGSITLHDYFSASALYECRLLGDPNLMVCRVSGVPAHYMGEKVSWTVRYEGFQHRDYSPFR